MNNPGANIIPYRSIWPRVAPSVYIAPGSSVIGDVVMKPHSSLWFNCAVRGDVNNIKIGIRTNIQDGTIIHTSSDNGATLIGDNVVVGHKCLLHACIVEDACMIGMGSTVMDYSVIETGAWVAAGSLVTPNKRIKKRELWIGRPAKFLRHVSSEETEEISRIVSNYVVRAQEYS